MTNFVEKIRQNFNVTKLQKKEKKRTLATME
jgi:hypothetical protein